VAGTTRRQFITGSLLFSTAFVGYHAWGRRPWTATPTTVRLPPARGATLAAVFAVVLGDEAAGAQAAASLEAALDDDQIEMLGLALQFLEFAPRGLLTARRFSRMDPADQTAVIQAWESSRLAVRRQVVGALRQACRFHHYSRPDTWAAIGYDGPWVTR
jgi:hypothetical protein